MLLRKICQYRLLTWTSLAIHLVFLICLLVVACSRLIKRFTAPVFACSNLETQSLNQNSRFPCRDTNLVHSPHEVGMLPSEPCWTADSSWNVMAHGDAMEGKWRGNWRMQWVASTLHITSEHGVSSIITADSSNMCTVHSTVRHFHRSSSRQ